jgi:hypothetical protein
VNPPTILGATAALMLMLAPHSAAALTQAGASGVAPASPAASIDGAPVDGGGGNVTVTVPGSAVAVSDGIDQPLQGDHSYRAAFLVWVAPNVGKATLVLRADGAKLSKCTSMRLRPGATSAVTCLVRGDTAGSQVAIDAVVQTSNLGTFSRTFSHAFTQ